jgi:hypothetical protein
MRYPPCARSPATTIAGAGRVAARVSDDEDGGVNRYLFACGWGPEDERLAALEAQLDPVTHEVLLGATDTQLTAAANALGDPGLTIIGAPVVTAWGRR